MQQNFQSTAADQMAAFQKIWSESAAKMFQAAFTASPESPPPEILKQMRTGIFSALAQSWDEFMRSPQFLQSMKDCMEQAINFRKLTNDWMAKMRNDLQAPSREDTDMVMIATRHLEKRVLDRLEQLANEIKALRAELPGRRMTPRSNAAAKARTARRTKPKKAQASA